jgi:hypothetical protein
MFATPEVIAAFRRLHANPDFGLVIHWIRDEQSAQTDALLDLSNQVLVHQKQGYCQALRDITKAATPENRPA